MQARIIPGKAEGLDQEPDASQKSLGQEFRVSVIIRIAEINTTAQRPSLSSTAATVFILPRTGSTIVKRPARGWCVREEYRGLDFRNVQPVTVLLEPAAAAAEQTNRPERGDLGIEFGIERVERFPNLVGIDPRVRFGAGDRVRAHEIVRDAAASISSTLYHCP